MTHENGDMLPEWLKGPSNCMASVLENAVLNTLVNEGQVLPIKGNRHRLLTTHVLGTFIMVIRIGMW